MKRCWKWIIAVVVDPMIRLRMTWISCGASISPTTPCSSVTTTPTNSERSSRAARSVGRRPCTSAPKTAGKPPPAPSRPAAPSGCCCSSTPLQTVTAAGSAMPRGVDAGCAHGLAQWQHPGLDLGDLTATQTGKILRYEVGQGERHGTSGGVDQFDLPVAAYLVALMFGLAHWKSFTVDPFYQAMAQQIYEARPTQEQAEAAAPPAPAPAPAPRGRDGPPPATHGLACGKPWCPGPGGAGP